MLERYSVTLADGSQVSAGHITGLGRALYRRGITEQAVEIWDAWRQRPVGIRVWVDANGRRRYFTRPLDLSVS